MIDPASSRYQREFNTLRAMAEIYCQDLHGSSDGLCSDCAAFLEYAKDRLGRCAFGESKPACSECPIHCYKPEERERAKAIMKHSGPKMLARAPFLTLFHFWDKYRSSTRIRQWREAKNSKKNLL